MIVCILLNENMRICVCISIGGFLEYNKESGKGKVGMYLVVRGKKVDKNPSPRLTPYYYQSRIDGKSASVCDTTKTLEECERALAEHRRNLSMCRGEIESCKARISSGYVEFAKHKEALDSNNRLQALIEELEKRGTVTSGDLNTSRESVVALRSELAEKEAMFAREKEALEKLAAARLGSETERAVREKVALVTERFQMERSALEKTIRELQSEKTVLGGDFEKCSVRVKDLEKEVRALQGKLDLAEKDKGLVDKQIDALTSRSRDAEGQLVALRTLQGELDKARADHAGIVRERDSVSSLLRASEAKRLEFEEAWKSLVDFVGDFAEKANGEIEVGDGLSQRFGELISKYKKAHGDAVFSLQSAISQKEKSVEETLRDRDALWLSRDAEMAKLTGDLNTALLTQSETLTLFNAFISAVDSFQSSADSEVDGISSEIGKLRTVLSEKLSMAGKDIEAVRQGADASLTKAQAEIAQLTRKMSTVDGDISLSVDTVRDLQKSVESAFGSSGSSSIPDSAIAMSPVGTKLPSQQEKEKVNVDLIVTLESQLANVRAQLGEKESAEKVLLDKLASSEKTTKEIEGLVSALKQQSEAYAQETVAKQQEIASLQEAVALKEKDTLVGKQDIVKLQDLLANKEREIDVGRKEIERLMASQSGQGDDSAVKALQEAMGLKEKDILAGRNEIKSLQEAVALKEKEVNDARMEAQSLKDKDKKSESEIDGLLDSAISEVNGMDGLQGKRRELAEKENGTYKSISDAISTSTNGLLDKFSQSVGLAVSETSLIQDAIDALISSNARIVGFLKDNTASDSSSSKLMKSEMSDLLSANEALNGVLSQVLENWQLTTSTIEEWRAGYTRFLTLAQRLQAQVLAEKGELKTVGETLLAQTQSAFENLTGLVDTLEREVMVTGDVANGFSGILTKYAELVRRLKVNGDASAVEKKRLDMEISDVQAVIEDLMKEPRLGEDAIADVRKVHVRLFDRIRGLIQKERVGGEQVVALQKRVSELEKEISAISTGIRGVENFVEGKVVSDIEQVQGAVNRMLVASKALRSGIRSYINEIGPKASKRAGDVGDLVALVDTVSGGLMDFDTMDSKHRAGMMTAIGTLRKRLETAVAERDDAVARVSELDAQSTSASRDLAELEKQFSSFVRDLENGALVAIDSEISQTNSTISKLQLLFSSVFDKIRTLQGELKTVQVDSAGEVTKLREEVDALVSFVSQVDLSVGSMGVEVNGIVDVVSSLSGAISSVSQRVSELISRLGQAERDKTGTVASCEARIADLSSVLDDLSSGLDSGFLNVDGVDITLVRDTFEKLLAEISSLRTKVEGDYKEKLSELESVRAERDTALLRTEEIQGKFDEVEKLFAGLFEDGGDLQGTISGLAGDVSKVSGVFSNFVSKIQSLQSEIDSFKSDTESATLKIREEHEREADALRAERDSLRDDISKVGAVIDTSLAELDATNISIDIWKEVYERVLESYSLLKRKLDGLSGEQDKVRLELDKENAMILERVSRLENEISDISAEFTVIVDARVRLAGRVEEIRDNLAKATADLVKQKALFGETHAKLSACYLSQSALEDDLRTRNNTIKALQAEKEKMSIENARYRQRISELEAEKQALGAKVADIQASVKEQKVAIQPVIAAAKENCDIAIAEIEEMLVVVDKNYRHINVINERIEALRSSDSDKADVIGIIDRWNAFYKALGQRWMSSVNALDRTTPLTSLSCRQVGIMSTEIAELVRSITEFDNLITNTYEDIAGAVRVYIKLKPMRGVPSIVGKDLKYITFDDSTCGKGVGRFGPFFGVMPEEFDTFDSYRGCKGASFDPQTFKMVGGERMEVCCRAEDPQAEEDTRGLCRALDQIKDGYHPVLFGYGTSGSGKTYTLFGDSQTRVPGVIHFAIANLGASTVRVVNVFELCATTFKLDPPNAGGKVIYLYGKEEGKLPGGVKTVNVWSEFEKHLRAEGFDTRVLENMDSDAVFALTTHLESFRRSNQPRIKEYPTIKATPNNPNSSRSHLFIMLEFQFAGKSGYLTLVDMGGMESPVDIFELFFKPKEGVGVDKTLSQIVSVSNNLPISLKNYDLHTFTPTDPLVSWYSDPTKFAKLLNSYLSPYTSGGNPPAESEFTRLLVEGVFINETINQMTYYFLERLRNEKEAKDRVKVSKAGGKTYEPTKLLAGVNTPTGKTVGMYSIMEFLAKYRKKPSKFIMMFMIRGEKTYCTPTFETLKVAQDLTG